MSEPKWFPSYVRLRRTTEGPPKLYIKAEEESLMVLLKKPPVERSFLIFGVKNKLKT